MANSFRNQNIPAKLAEGPCTGLCRAFYCWSGDRGGRRGVAGDAIGGWVAAFTQPPLGVRYKSRRRPRPSFHSHCALPTSNSLRTPPPPPHHHHHHHLSISATPPLGSQSRAGGRGLSRRRGQEGAGRESETRSVDLSTTTF